MNLILWRHAEAEDGSPDLARRLTDKGKRQARVMAEWLLPRLPAGTRILVSPATRTRQTADALDIAYTVVDDIAPDADPAVLLATAGWPTAGGSVLVVGHQPTLGLAASLVMSGEETQLGMKKGAVFWFSRKDKEEGAQTVLHAAMSPDMLKE